MLLVLPSVVHRDRYPQCFPSGSRCWGRGCSVEACERISHIFYVLALLAWNLDLISLSPLFWQPLVVYFLREKWTPSSPRSSHTGNLNIISTSSIWQRTKPPVPASVYVASGRISHIFIVAVDSDFPAQFALENLDIISTCSHMAVGRGFRRL